MNIGYVLVQTVKGKEREVYEYINRLPFVKEHYSLFGEYNFIVKLEDENLENMKEVVATKIKTIDDILKTKILISVPEYRKSFNSNK